MLMADGWWFPEGEKHLIEWMANPSVRMVLNGRAAYQGRKQVAALGHCRQFRTACDVGSHIGLWTHNLAAAFDTVHAFEPVDEHRMCFRLNVDAPNVTLHPIALGAREGSVRIHTAPTSSGDSWVAGDGDIPMRTLDSFELADVDFVKVDVEGFEENVLRGAVRTIQRCRPTICVEAKRDMAKRFGLQPQGSVEWLKARGYLVAEVWSGDYICIPG